MGFPGTQSIVYAYLLGPFVQVNLKTTCPRDNKKGPFFQALLNPYFKSLVTLLQYNYLWISVYRFALLNAGILYIYFTNFQKIDEEEYGGPWELTKEGFMTSFALFLVGILETKGVATKYFYGICIFFKVGVGGGGMQIQGRHLFKGDNIYFNHAMWCPWMGHSLMILHVIIVYSMKMNIHLYLTLCEVGGDTHTPAFLSWLSLPPFLLIFSPLFTFTLPYTIWTG